MRKSIAKTLEQLMAKNENIYLLFGDLGFGILDSIREKFPERAVNVGISEQAMIGIASGLALEGKIPVVYSIAPFIASRAFEQIKLNVCQQNQKVIMIGCGSGFSYGSLGPTHHCLEDFNILNSLPNMKIYMPYDSKNAAELFSEHLLNGNGPAYFRLGQDGLDIPELQNDFEKYVSDSNNHEEILVANGSMAKLALEVSKKAKINLKIITDSNFDFLSADYNFVIEDMYLNGGLFSIIKRFSFGKSVVRFGPDDFAKTAGTSEYLLEQQGVSVESICNLIQIYRKIKNNFERKIK